MDESHKPPWLESVPKLQPLAPGFQGQADALFHLLALLNYILMWGKPAFETSDPELRDGFRQLVEDGVLWFFLRELQTRVVEAGYNAPATWLESWFTEMVKPGSPIPENYRKPLIEIVRSMHSEAVRLDGLARRKRTLQERQHAKKEDAKVAAISDSTIKKLKHVKATSQGDKGAKGQKRPGKAGRKQAYPKSAKHAVDLRKRIPQPSMKEIFEQCKTKYPKEFSATGVSFEAFKKTVLRTEKKTEQSQ